VNSQKVGGHKRTTGRRCNQVTVLSFLNSLWKENCSTFDMCHSMNCEGKCRRHRKRYTQRLVTLQLLMCSESLGNSAHLKTFCEEANHTFLVAAEEMHGSSLQRDESLPHLLSRPCKRRLKTSQCFKF